MEKMQQEPLLKIHQLVRKAGKRVALDIPQLEVGEGEIVALIGPARAGKTYLLDVILGLQHTKNAEVVLGGQTRNAKAFRNCLAYVPSVPPLFGGGMTPRKLFALTEHMCHKNCRADWEPLCEMFEIPLQKELSRMTYTQNRLVSFINAMMRQPSLLVVDDLENYLEASMVFRLLTVMQEKQMTVLYSERQLQPTWRFCSRAYYMDHGVLDRTFVLDDSFVRKMVVTFPARYAWITETLRGSVIQQTDQSLYFLYEGSRKYLLDLCHRKHVYSIWMEPLTVDEQLLEDYERWQV